MVFWPLIILGSILLCMFAIGWVFSTPAYRGTPRAHFQGGTFRNQNGAKAKGLLAVFKWIFQRDSGPWTKNYEEGVGEPPVAHSEELIITFVNHSTFLIQWKNLNILTDPIWSERCSPLTFVGPLRMRPPGIKMEDLPKIDLVLLSHNHYDHLDIRTIKILEADHQPQFVVPLGVARYLQKNKIKKIHELDWHDTVDTGIQITSTPAQHFSGRGMFDRDKSLWCGYLLQINGHKVYFAGDSGYGDLFKEIGQKYGPMHVSLIPIGAYIPRWFMAPIHMSPDLSIQAHMDVQSQHSIAMHFGTFPLADEGQGVAEDDLQSALSEKEISPDEFIIPEEGTPMTFQF